MYSYPKIRRFELIFVLSAIAAYVIRRLIELARDFENDIRLAQKAGVSNHKILQDLLIYDHNLNSIFPTVAAAIFFAAAWYVFHFLAYPKIKELNKESQILD